MSLTILQELEKGAVTILERINAIMVKTADDYVSAAEFKKECKARQKDVNEAFDPIVKDANTAWKKAIDQRTKYLAPYVEAENAVDAKIRVYLNEEERKRREEEARVQEAQRKEAARLQKRSEKAAEQGKTEKAEELRERAEQTQIATPIIPSTVPKVAGMVKRKIWKFKIVNASLIPREYLVPDEVAIGAVARAMKEKTNIPGVQVYEDLVI